MLHTDSFSFLLEDMANYSFHHSLTSNPACSLHLTLEPLSVLCFSKSQGAELWSSCRVKEDNLKLANFTLGNKLLPLILECKHCVSQSYLASGPNYQLAASWNASDFPTILSAQVSGVSLAFLALKSFINDFLNTSYS